MRELSTKVVDHFKAVSIEDRTDAKKAILPLLRLRIGSRALSARRRTRKDEKHLGQSVPLETLDYEPANAGDDSGDAAVEKLRTWLAPKWNRLSPTEKKVIQFTILREPPMTDDEAAKEIGTTPGNVKVTRYRALKKLRP
jgi:DNA-directed RNA polymerase specialized sigma24 family protein